MYLLLLTVSQCDKTKKNSKETISKIMIPFSAKFLALLTSHSKNTSSCRYKDIFNKF